MGIVENERSIEEVYELIEKTVHNKEDLKAIKEKLSAVEEELTTYKEERIGTETKIKEILEVIVAYANLDYSKKVPISDQGGIIDALSSGINMLSEEMEASTVSRDYFIGIVDNLVDLVAVVNIDGTIQGINRSLQDALGYTESELKRKNISVIFEEEFIFTKGKGSLQQLQKTGSLHMIEKTCVRSNGEKFPSLFSANMMRGPLKEEYVVCVIQDITDRKEVEEEIKASLNEKEVLIKEVHHRVKNNLQVISSLLNLQSSYIEDEKSLEKFKESQLRVKSMALIHEMLYRSEDLSRIDFKDYLESLLSSLASTYNTESPKVVTHINVDVKNKMFKIDNAIPCGLIVNELVSNAFKYAFPDGMAGNIYLDFKYEGRKNNTNYFKMIVQDDGIGVPETLDFRNTTTLGMQLITTLTEQLDGTIELDRTNGTCFIVDFQVKE